MKKAIVLIMHGMPPKDFPRDEKKEYMRLRAKYHDNPMDPQDENSVRHHELELKMRNWPRTKENDPFFVASNELARNLEGSANSSVFVGFNEFCSPSAERALETAAQSGAGEVIVVTPMLTPGGNHSEEEIPELIHQAQANYPATTFRYAWPFNSIRIAEFLASHLSQFEEKQAVHG